MSHKKEMSSNDQFHLPKIDFSGLDISMTGTGDWEATRELIIPAIKTNGIFEAVYNKITPELEDALFGKAMKEVFRLPLEAKMRNVSNKPYHGYVGNIPGCAFESLAVDNAAERRGVDEFSGLMWGDEGNPSFSNTIFAFSKHLSKLEQMVRRMVLEILGVEKYFDQYVESTAYALRLSEYRSFQQDNLQTTKLGMQSHTDTTILSIVCQRGVEGLQVQTKDGRWLTPSPNSMTVIFGEAFWAWTNGRIEPALHRVVINGDETRYSAIFTARPQDGHLVKAPAELIDDEHPLQFRPYEYGDYIRFSFSEVGFKTKCALKAYCGVQTKEEDDVLCQLLLTKGL